MAASENQCERMQDLLSLFVDGRLAPDDVARVKAHVAHCANCASYLGFLRATSSVIANRFSEVRPPADLYARIAQMTYERPTPLTWSQRLSQLLAPAPTRWALGTALAAAGIVGVAFLSKGTSNPIADGHSRVPLAATTPDSSAIKPTRTKSQVAIVRPSVKKVSAPATVSAPPVAADSMRQTAFVVAHPSLPSAIAVKSTVPARHATPSEAEAPTLAVTSPTAATHVSLPSVPAVVPITRPAVVKPAPRIQVASIARAPISASVLAALHGHGTERDHLTLATRAMEINQRKAAMADITAHEPTSQPVIHRDIPVEASTINPSTTVAVAAPPQVQVAQASRHTLFGLNNGQKLSDPLAGIKTNQHASVNNQYALNEHSFIPVVQDKPTDEK